MSQWLRSAFGSRTSGYSTRFSVGSLDFICGFYKIVCVWVVYSAITNMSGYSLRNRFVPLSNLDMDATEDHTSTTEVGDTLDLQSIEPSQVATSHRYNLRNRHTISNEETSGDISNIAPKNKKTSKSKNSRSDNLSIDTSETSNNDSYDNLTVTGVSYQDFITPCNVPQCKT